MQVFISWSGDRSRMVADAIRTWLPRVLQSIKPWMSETDISAGSRWLAEVSGVLDGSSIGIIVITPENLSSPWLHFEAGALSKALDESRVCPVAFELTPGQIVGPLSQFQAVSADKSGILRVLVALNKSLGDKALPDAELQEIYEVWWPKLEEKLRVVPPSPTPHKAREVHDQLEELLQITREQLRRENLRLEASQSRDQKFDELFQLMEGQMLSIAPLRSAVSGFQAKLAAAAHAAANAASSIEKDEIDDPKAAAELIRSMGSLLPSQANLDFDVDSVTKMTAALKQFQFEDRARRIEILNGQLDGTPGKGGKPSD